VGKGYGQFCPVALASETLAQRWILLIVREMCAGATRFSDIRRGLPGISASLLKQRLDVLEAAGVVRRPRSPAGKTPAYVLTAAGEELRPVIASIGAWGQRWARDIRDADLDPSWLVWAMHRRLDTRVLPRGRTVIELDFTDAPMQRRTFWLICKDGAVDVCLKPPGFETDLTVTTSVRTLAEIWRGLRSLGPEMRAGRLRLDGGIRLRHAFPSSLLLSPFARIERRRR
jgi:DNA-binding HxlR family transcriptional regulator